MTPESIKAEIQSLVDKYGTQETHLASVEFAGDLATLALGAELYESSTYGFLMKIAFAIGFEARREVENYKPLDDDIWNIDF